MKFLFIQIYLLLAATVVLSQTTPEEQQIVQFIEFETNEFLYKSKAQVVSENWVMDDCTLTNVTDPYGNAKQFDLTVSISQTNIPPPNHAKARKYNFGFLIRGNMAFVTCDQEVTFPDTPDILYSKEYRVLEKVNGQWKIHQLSVHHFQP